MIAKITSGRNTGKLISYLYGPGRANEHTDPHLVASWYGFALDPGRTDDFNETKNQLVKALDLRVKQAGDRAPEQHVWHCSIRAAPEDRTLSDDEWADIARRVVAATGIAPDGDPDGCRWVAVRHADDHIHIAATKVRGDLRPARHWNDYLTADRELAAIEKEYGLHEVIRGDRTAAQRPTRAEQEKAHRTGHQRTARERLRSTVRTAVSATSTPEEFLRILASTGSVRVEIQRFPSGAIRGYKVALEGDTNSAGEPIWFSGSKLAPDLSFPKIQQRLAGTQPQPVSHLPRHHKPNPWHRATAAMERIPHHLDKADDEAAQAHLAAFGEALDALPLISPQDIRPRLREAATAFERATRSRIRAEHHHARTLRGAIRSMLRESAPKDGAALAMFLDAALLVVIAAARWHQLRHHDQQVAAAHRTLLNLRTAYEQAAAAPLAALARRKPPAETVDRLARQLWETVPSHAQQILDARAWDALATALAEAESVGQNSAIVLQQAIHQRPLDDARRPAEVLTWRIRRLGKRRAPSARSVAAQARPAVDRSVQPTRTSPAGAVPEAPAPRRPRR
ncbi:relaxase/mobilization nuclease domain-containing protein [Streptomyces sp. NPDC021225]|uniref:relaxase/mobilization nuclease domain-containing protein n=1 Tax=Streptomyces sp. NPDC021225 TaxID=3365121 RepID=UPI00378B55B3